MLQQAAEKVRAVIPGRAHKRVEDARERAYGGVAE
jgi:hypothetical protein